MTQFWHRCAAWVGLTGPTKAVLGGAGGGGGGRVVALAAGLAMQTGPQESERLAAACNGHHAASWQCGLIAQKDGAQPLLGSCAQQMQAADWHRPDWGVRMAWISSLAMQLMAGPNGWLAGAQAQCTWALRHNGCIRYSVSRLTGMTDAVRLVAGEDGRLPVRMYSATGLR